MVSERVPVPAASCGAAEAVPLIRFLGVSKSFGPVTAVQELTLELKQGEIFALLGPSGCGKTTLMRMLAGFETPDSGAIWLDGQDITLVPPHQRPLNMMFQSYALFPHLSVTGNIAFGLERQNLPKFEIESRVAELIELVQLQGLESRKPAQLSGGQQQRVALARALARRPKVLLLDEPLAALDRKMREQTQRQLLDIQAKLGTTFVLVTHDQDEAMTMADRIGVMQDGQLAQVGTPREVYDRPASRFVAGFLGEVNLLDATVATVGAGGITISVPALGRDLSCRVTEAAVAVGQAVSLALRPERIGLSLADTARPDDVSGVITAVTYKGCATQVRVRLACGDEVRVVVPNSPTEPACDLVAGKVLRLTIQPDACMVLAR